MDEERLLLHGSAARDPETEMTNARVLNRAGTVEHSFNIGGPSELLANENWIVTHYSDQAMTSDDYPVDREGLAVFDANGSFLWGFESHFAGKPRLDVFFHAAVWVGPDEVGVYRDLDRKLSTLEGFIRVNVRDRSHQVWEVPREAFLASALTTVDDRVLFYSPLRRTGIVRWLKVKAGRASLPPGEDDIIEWQVGSEHCQVVGHYPARGQLRGLPGGRFIAPKPDGYTIISFD